MRACACALLRSLWLLVESVVRCYPLVLVGTPNPSQPWFWTCCGVTASALPPSAASSTTLVCLVHRPGAEDEHVQRLDLCG